MQQENLIEKKNIFDFNHFKLKKVSNTIQSNTSNVVNIKSINIKSPISNVQLDFSTRIQNIKQSVQRINMLLEEIKQISEKPNK